MENRVRELALFSLGIYSKLGGYDLIALEVRDISHGNLVQHKAFSVAEMLELERGRLMPKHVDLDGYLQDVARVVPGQATDFLRVHG